MSEVFHRRRHGRLYVQLPADAAGLLVNLAGQLVELLSDGEASTEAVDPLEELVGLDTSHREPPTDAALRRLLPDGFTTPDGETSDPEAAAEFRRFTERGLRDGKIRDAKVVLETIGDVPGETDGDEGVDFELDADQAQAWLRSLNDMRLTIAERLEVAPDDEEHWATLPEDDPRRPVHDIYLWLGFVLEDLLETLSH